MLRTAFVTLFMASASLPAISEIRAAEPAMVEVKLENFAFSPDTVKLDHDHDYVLRLNNTASGGHSFSAADFFAASQVEAADGAKIKKGAVDVPSHSTVTIHLKTGHAGVYKLKCTHFLHNSFGMKGQIIVR